MGKRASAAALWMAAPFGLLLTAGALCAAETPPAAPSGKPASLAEWPQWRGPNRDGVVVSGPKLLDSWPEEGPRLLWRSERIPCGSASWATDGGASSPVVADGRVFVYADAVQPKYVVTSKMLADWGWMDGVPDDLATKIEAARVSPKREKLAGAELYKYIEAFLATLEPGQAKQFGDHARKRIAMGMETAGWLGMQTIVGAGAQDKAFASYEEWQEITYKGRSFRDHDLVDGHGDGGLRGNYIQAAVLKGVPRTDTIYCLDAKTGKQLWKKEYPGQTEPGFDWYWFSGASATPTVLDGKCYVVGSAGLYCLSAEDGTELWKTKTHFTNSSPLVVDGAVYVLFGHRACRPPVPGELTAFDAKTGAVLWRQPEVWGIYSSPALWTGADGSRCLVLLALGGPYLVDHKTGKVLCKLATRDCGAPWNEYATPVVSGNTFVIVLSRTLHAYHIEYPTARHAWSTNYGRGDGDRGLSPLVYQGYAYQFGRGGCACIDLNTGEVKWKGTANALETPSSVVADGKVFVKAPKQLRMYLASPTGPEKLLARMPDTSAPFVSPVTAAGRLYLRTPTRVVCYDLEDRGR